MSSLAEDGYIDMFGVKMRFEPNEERGYFRKLRRLAERWRRKNGNKG